MYFQSHWKHFMLKFDTHDITWRNRFNTEIFLAIRHCHLENTYGQAYLTLLECIVWHWCPDTDMVSRGTVISCVVGWSIALASSYWKTFRYFSSRTLNRDLSQKCFSSAGVRVEHIIIYIWTYGLVRPNYRAETITRDIDGCPLWKYLAVVMWMRPNRLNLTPLWDQLTYGYD